MPTCFINSNPTYRPQRMFITAITQANPAQVTTSVDHNYLTGLIIRFFIPTLAGMRQLHKRQAAITVTSDNTFTVPIETTNFDAFVVAADPALCAQVLPIGEVNSILTMAAQNVLT